MKNPVSSSQQSVLNLARGHANSDRRYRRDLSLPRAERKIAQNMAEQLQLMEQYITRIPQVDLQRRNAIRNAIATGNYIIDPMAIADKFLKFERELFS